MLLADRLTAHGRLLFRWRSYLPLLLFAVIIPGLERFAYPKDSHRYDLAWEWFCFAVSLSGLVLRCLTVGYVPRGTSGRNTKCQHAERLNTTGMYSITRNPLYLGNFLVGLGFTLVLRQWWLPLLYALAFWLYYERIILAEEAFLLEKFGAAYAEYVARVPVFIPKPSLWQKPDMRFCFRAVIRREYSTLFMIVAVFTFLDVLTDLPVRHRVAFDPFWSAAFGMTAILYLIIRFLKMRTNVLTVLGR